MKHTASKFAFAFVLGVICEVGIGNVALAQSAPATKENELITINQVGYLPGSPKRAVVDKGIKDFIIEDSFHKAVFHSSSLSVKYWPFSGDSVRIADFSAVKKPGKYWLVDAAHREIRHPFVVADSVYRGLSCASLRAFYYNRASVEIPESLGGVWHRAMGHPDQKIFVHASAASGDRPEGTVISSPKGWYDAGDYNKYIVNSGITGYTLLLAYQLAPRYYQSLSLHIPESGNKIPDILNELLWNIRWMLTMQDPNDGGVYHKLTNKGFDGFVMPNVATLPRYVVQKSTAASLDFAALMASCSRVFSQFPKQLPGFADSCLQASKAAWKWSMAHPAILYQQPSDISTGKYDDDNLSDEWCWAATELSIATHEKSYLPKVSFTSIKQVVPTWNNVGMLAVYSFALYGKDVDATLAQAAKAKLVDLADKLCQKQASSAFDVSLDYFDWGSNSDVAQQGVAKILANLVTGKRGYLESAAADLDYLLGRNPLGFCYVTGFGQRSPMHIHHRPSGADGVDKPVPGFLVGGPNLVVPTDCSPNPTRSTVFPARSYDDSLCSYSTNEIAINWNAPLAFLVGLLDSKNRN